MTGLMDLLPLIEGWDYNVYTIPYHVIFKGAPQLRLKIEKPGWVLQYYMITTDAFGTVLVKVRGPGGIEHVAAMQPEGSRLVGNLLSDPAGYLSMYNRPNPAITNGFYVYVTSIGLSGTPLPIIGNVAVETYLEAGSTQNAALLTAAAVVIEIKDKRLFLESLAKFGSPAAILAMAGMTTTEQKSPAPAQTSPVQFSAGDVGSQILEELKKIRESLEGRGR